METVIVVGAGPAGLAVAGALKQRGVTATVLEAESEVGSAWRRHYRRLHLHTHKGGSSLPGLDFPAAFPRYPSRAQVVEYLELYQRTFALAPSFGERVTNIEPGWKVTTSKRTLEARHVVVATGYTRVPLEPDFPGRSTFTGETLHSSRYVDGAGFAGKRVLVVGFGNSGGEIAIDLVEHGAQPTLSVRGPVNVIPRELLGLPILGVSAVMRMFPPRVADALSAPLLALSIGDIRKLGLRRQPYGPMEQIRRDGRIPLIDVGTLRLIREGKIALAPGLERFTPTEAVFEGGLTQPFDAVVFATGYRPALGAFLPLARDFCDARGFPKLPLALPEGLHLCGFDLSTRGMLKEISIEAKHLAAQIAAAPAPRQLAS